MNILLVEDEARVADFILRGLKSEGWLVTHAPSGESALNLLADDTFDVVLLDLMLPGISGQDVCRKMRARKNHTPVLMLTALDAVEERISGLGLGADDYLAKPFDFDELVARITALHRRTHDYEDAEEATILRCGDIRFDCHAMTVAVADQPVELTAKERDILSLLLSNPNKVFGRERILSRVWSVNEDPLTNVVDVYIGRLRKKLGDSGRLIQTVRGSGYRISVGDQVGEGAER